MLLADTAPSTTTRPDKVLILHFPPFCYKFSAPWWSAAANAWMNLSTQMYLEPGTPHCHTAHQGQSHPQLLLSGTLGCSWQLQFLSSPKNEVFLRKKSPTEIFTQPTVKPRDKRSCNKGVGKKRIKCSYLSNN